MFSIKKKFKIFKVSMTVIMKTIKINKLKILQLNNRNKIRNHQTQNNVIFYNITKI